MSESLPLRFIIVCLHPTSARLRFLKNTSGHICLPEALPPLSELLDDFQPPEGAALHPGAFLKQLSEQTGIPADCLSVEQSMRCWVNVPRATLPIFCLRTVDELPFTAPEGYQWIDLPDCFSLNAIEQQMMRRVYQWLME